MQKIFNSLQFSSGHCLDHRLALAPLTNSQSREDGCLSDEEIHWLTLRAEGGFAMTMTAAAYVNPQGRGFAGQLGISGDEHLPGLTRLATTLKANNSLAIVQLHHAGLRAPKELIGQPPSAPSNHDETGAIAMATADVETLIEDFINAAARAQQAGFDGVDIHGAHNYVICQFLSADYNQRTDQYGGSLAARCKVLMDIVSGIRKHCGTSFTIGVRLTPERHGILLEEAITTAQWLLDNELIDFLDMSLWDVYKEPVEAEYQGRSLLSYFTELQRDKVKLGVVGKIYTRNDINYCLDAGADFVMLGRAAILHHNYPQLLKQDADFKVIQTPVSADYLYNQGLSDTFINYMRNWKGFVSP